MSVLTLAATSSFSQKNLELYLINGSDTTYFNDFISDESFGISVNRKKEDIVFSDSTHYEIYDTYGNRLRSDEAKVLKVKDLKKGLYYFNFVFDEKRSFSYFLNIKK